jgi:glycine hydroxymethyltransferase
MENFYDLIAITLNKNFIAGDNALEENGGVRIGTPAMTSRELKEDDCKTVVQFLHKGLQLALKIKKDADEAKVDFFEQVKQHDSEITKLRDEVESFSKKFPMPGFDIESMKYHNDSEF